MSKKLLRVTVSQVLGCPVRCDIGCREETPSTAELSRPPMLVWLVRHCDHVSPSKFQLTMFLKKGEKNLVKNKAVFTGRGGRAVKDVVLHNLKDE